MHRYDSLLKPYQSSARYVLEVSFILHLVHSSAILKLTTLQVGVKKGGSIKLLREYFHQKCTIIGVDVDKGCPQFPYDGHIKTVLASSTDSDSMRKAFKVKTLLFTEAVFDSVT